MDDLASSAAASRGLAERLAALEAAGSQAPWQDEVRALQAQLDELGTSGSTPVHELEERLATVEKSARERPWRTEVNSLADGVSAQLASLKGQLDDTPWRDEVAALQSRIDALAPSSDVRGLAQRVDSLEARDVDPQWRNEAQALRAELDQLGVASSVHAQELAERVAAVEATAVERPWRKELKRLTDEVGERLEGLAGRLDETGVAGRERIEQLGASVAALAARLDTAGEQWVTTEELATLQSRLDDHAASGFAVGEGLSERLSAVEAMSHERPWRNELRGLAD